MTSLIDANGSRLEQLGQILDHEIGAGGPECCSAVAAQDNDDTAEPTLASSGYTGFSRFDDAG